MWKKTFIGLLLISFVSCNTLRLNLDKGIIPLAPVNFSDINSSHDDYNSMLRITWSWKSFSLIFSTNRETHGNNFDFIVYDCEVESDLINGKFEVRASQGSCSLVDSVNSSFNELGPYSTFNFETDGYPNKESEQQRFFYTTDINGNNDIYYSYYSVDEKDFLPSGDTAWLTGINTDFDEGYLTFHKDEAANRETVYFTSNRDADYDIYRAVSEEDKLIDQSPEMTVSKVEQLSSDADDKCPYISEDMMVFTSDRDGGFGGFDLWYSLYDGQQWSAPVNFGERINTAYDEYRPIIIRTDADDFFNDMMIFSSNRPGGKGFFDLYYVGMRRRD